MLLTQACYVIPNPHPIVIDCGDLDDPEHGSVDLAGGTGLDSVAQYSCGPDYMLSGTGSGTRTCLESSQWSGTAPTCESNAFK